MKLNLKSFEEDPHHRVGDVDINFLNGFYKTLKFLWRDWQEPGSTLSIFNAQDEKLFDFTLGNEEVFKRLPSNHREIITGIQTLFHAREGHLEGYDGNGEVPLSVPERLRSGSCMTVAV